MKHRYNYFYIKRYLSIGTLILFLLLVHSCTKSPVDPPAPGNDISEQEWRLLRDDLPPDTLLLLPAVDSLAGKLDSVMLSHNSLVKSLFYASNSFLKENSRKSTRTAGEELEPSMVTMMNDLDIISETNGAPLDFYAMGLPEQRVFLDLFLLEETRRMSERLAEAPELRGLYILENQAISEILVERGHPVLKLGYLPNDLQRMPEQPQKDETADLFASIAEAIAKKGEQTVPEEIPYDTPPAEQVSAH